MHMTLQHVPTLPWHTHAQSDPPCPFCTDSDRAFSSHTSRRLLDQQEKEDFEARLRSKDDERTKKLAEDSSKLSKSEQKEEAKRK